MPKTAIALVAAFALATTASAQTTAPQSASTQGGLGGLGGLLGGALPNVGSIGAGNAAGLLGYCLKNNLLGQSGALSALTGGRNAASRTGSAKAPATGAQSILQRLTGRQGVQTSPGYAAGQEGEVQAPNGQAFSLDDLGGQVKTRMCSIVLNRAKSFL
ncbi:uncharacterized protein DUF2501 [Sphingomonas sp. PP-CE-1A-559]|uniref:DUF2501 domain-containing protein n=1 Tax=Sphingomonas sp. PP-CE-1A-559 TaxID=2135657 RepID=UPI001054BB60|nr:DUF2501 domain-containing protein [Sphingomonas sp. PP-CE-1A-559]TCP88673.1 uncharacterized protein DUF2501 [Sphingomonas sp. PP-CE-1A-559]